MRIGTVLAGIDIDLSDLTARRCLVKLLLSPGTAPVLNVLLMGLVFCLVSSQDCRADQLQELAKKAGLKILADGESSSDSQKKTVATIPFNQMAPASRQRAQKIVESCSQYRRLPSLQYTIDEPMYRYLLSNPDVAVSTWRVMGISRFEMWQTGPMEYEAKAVDGTEGIADILYKDDHQMLFICEGTYHNMLLPKPLAASALIWFRASYAPNAEGTQTVTQKADVFVNFPSPAFATVAKMLTPVTNGMMDRNIFEVSLYSSMMSRAVRDEPEWVVQVAEQMEGVLPQRKSELTEVARLPRKNPAGARNRSETVTSVDRSMIMSPQLFFFDPPKDGTKFITASDSSAGLPIQTAELSKDVSREKVRFPATDAEPGVSPELPTVIIPAAKVPRVPQVVVPSLGM